MTCLILTNLTISMMSNFFNTRKEPFVRLPILISIIASFALTFAMPAFADKASEDFVKENATLVLSTLDDSTLDQKARTEKFSVYMDQFSNIDRIASFVIGKYSRRFTSDEIARYRTAFRKYNLTAYEVQFDQYRGAAIEVTGSTDRNERDSIVDSTVRSPNGDTFDVRWRVLERNDKYEVVDIALNFEGSLLWLAIEQRAQFLDLLDRTNGSPDALIKKLDELTADLRK